MTHIGAGLMGPKSENVEKVLVFKAFLKGQKSPEGPTVPKTLRAGALSGHFGIAFWYMRVILDHFGITSGPLCGNFGYIKVLLKKH